MVLRFQTFRRILSVILALTAAISACLGIALLRLFLRPGAAYLLVSVEVASLIRSLWSIFRKPLFGTSQSVASEAVGLFILFPFQLIIALVISSVLPKQTNNTEGFLALRIFSVASSVLHLTYTLGLILLAIITVPAFDGDVWMRDIDSSPSPFPLAIIFAFMFPCIAYRFSSLRSLIPQPLTRDPSQNGCLSTCGPNCCDHGSRPNPKATSPSLGDSTQPRMVCPSEETLERMPPILPHTLIRIPNAAERRASIYLALPVESQ